MSIKISNNRSVIDHLENDTKPFVSFEIIPPKRGGKLENLLKIIEDLAEYNPPFIDITSHAADVTYEETKEGYQKKIKRKRPGTLGICALIQNKHQIDTVPHVLSYGFTKQETEDFLIELQYLGIKNILALRGDIGTNKKPTQKGKAANTYALDLVKQISDMNKGNYLEKLLDAEPTNFCTGVACYPEKHFESPNIEHDLKILQRKIDAGAEYAVTQMFYDNKKYFDFVSKCKEKNISIPIIPGIKVLTSKKHLHSLPRNFHLTVPIELSNEIEKSKEEHIVDIGAEWSYNQAKELVEKNVPSIHYYVMESSGPVGKVMKKLQKLIN
jgi:methylenetetrahydrofolate reductase (NADPH)